MTRLSTETLILLLLSVYQKCAFLLTLSLYCWPPTSGIVYLSTIFISTGFMSFIASCYLETLILFLFNVAKSLLLLSCLYKPLVFILYLSSVYCICFRNVSLLAASCYLETFDPFAIVYCIYLYWKCLLSCISSVHGLYLINILFSSSSSTCRLTSFYTLQNP